jgi:hypothetical protein
MKNIYLLILMVLLSSNAFAKVDLVTLPNRDEVQLTIYNSADLTLAKESRALTLRQGLNALQFSWENTLIDPTSLDMLPKTNSDKIDVFDLTFPPRVNNLGLWNIKSQISGDVPVEISYLTSGLSWRAFYLGTLSKDQTKMRLQGFVRVTNNSGEDYENAQVRLIVGKVHMIDQIAQLAQGKYPFGQPGVLKYDMLQKTERRNSRKRMKGGMQASTYKAMKVSGGKQIVKEGLSEYFLYTIEGRETIPHGFSKRLPSFDIQDIPVVNLYKYDVQRYGTGVTRFLSFKNDKKHKLGDTPIPGGMIKVFRGVNQDQNLSYEGQSNFKYIPVKEDVELNLGVVQKVVVTPTLMHFQTEKHSFNRQKNIDGWEEVRRFKIEVKNTQTIPIKIQVTQHFSTTNWKIINEGSFGEYTKVDKDTVRYLMQLRPNTTKEFFYTLRTYHGTRATK